MNDSPDQITLAPELPLPEQVLEGLNDQQKAATSHLGGPLLIVAGAGSGTRGSATGGFHRARPAVL